MVSKTEKEGLKSRKSGSLLPERKQFELDERTQVIGNSEDRHSSGNEVDVSRADQVATSTSRLDECNLPNKLSR